MTVQRILLFAISAMMAVAGCNNRSQTIDSSSGAARQVHPLYELVAQSQPPISDMPVPLTFKLDEGKSRNFAAAGARYVDHVYKGGADKFAVARFYKRQMPVARWTLVTDMFVQGDIMLDFEKQTERCRIIITDGTLFSASYIKAQLWTSGRIEQPTGKTGK